ncbi:unnamed protein product [Prunus armeniaca]
MSSEAVYSRKMAPGMSSRLYTYYSFGLGCDNPADPSSKPHGGAKRRSLGLHDASSDDLSLGNMWAILDADFSSPGKITYFPSQYLYMHWWMVYACNHCENFLLTVYLETWLSVPHRFQSFMFLRPIFLCWCIHYSYFTMSAQLNASSSHANSRSLNPKFDSRWGNGSIVEPRVFRKGKFTFRVDRNETKMSTSDLASTV